MKTEPLITMALDDYERLVRYTQGIEYKIRETYKSDFINEGNGAPRYIEIDKSVHVIDNLKYEYKTIITILSDKNP